MARVVSARLRPLAVIVLASLLHGGALRAQGLDAADAESPGQSGSPGQPAESDLPSNPERSSLGESDGNQCLSSHRAGQRLERSGRLLEATRAYRQCLRPHCSPVLRDDCGARLTRVESDTPTVILAAQHRGRDLALVDVYDADVLLQKGIKGVAVPLDPGPHQLRFVAPGFVPHSHSIVARVGEKNRLVVVVLEAEEDEVPPSAQSPVAAEPPRLAPRPRAEPPRSALGPWEYALFTTGAVLGVGGATLGLLALSDYRQAQSECAPTCADERMDDIRSKAFAADALLVLSVAAVVTGSVRVILAKQSSRGGVALVLSPGFVTAEGRF